MAQEILTDEQGRPFERPCREDFADTVSYLRACWAYRDAIANCANAGFAAQWRKSMRGAQ